MTDREDQADTAAETGARVDLSQALLAAARTNGATGRSAKRRPRSNGAGRVPTNRTSGPAPGIADLGMSGPGPDDRDPTPLTSSVDRLVHEHGWQVPVAVGGIEGRWAAIVGPDLASHCAPDGFDQGVVTVRADSTAWATQVRALAGSLVALLNDELGSGTVTAVRVVGPASPSWRKGKFRVPGRGPRDTYG